MGKDGPDKWKQREAEFTMSPSEEVAFRTEHSVCWQKAVYKGQKVQSNIPSSPASENVIQVLQGIQEAIDRNILELEGFHSLLLVHDKSDREK